MLPKRRAVPQNRCYRTHRKGGAVTDRARCEYAEALRPRYAQADKRERGRMLDEYCRATGSHRKAAIRCLRRQAGPARGAPGRPRRYGPELVPMLERVWLASDRLCGKLLAPVLPTYLQALEHHHGVVVPPAIRRALESASPATLERLLHSDNGGEFVNDVLVVWCRREAIRFTRGRPYRKNDQAWVEQRNGLVRRLVGYDRCSSRAAYTVFQRLYTLLRLQFNFFRPVRKLLSRRRVGSKVHKRYDTARTPYQRLVATGVLRAAQHQALERQRQTLDPIALARDIEGTLDTLWKLADTRPAAAEAARG